MRFDLHLRCRRPSPLRLSITRSLILLLSLAVPLVASPPPDLQIRIVGEADPAAEDETFEVRLWDGDRERFVPLRPAGESEQGLFAASETCLAGSVATVVSEKRVGPPVRLSSESCRPEVMLPIRLMPRATVHGRLAEVESRGASKDLAPPAVAEVETEPCPDDSGRSRESWGPYPAAVDEKGVWSAPVPAGCVHLRLSVGDYSRLSWWGLGLEPGDRTDLGTRRLRTGASVLVRVVSGTDGRALEGVRVALLPESATEKAWRASVAGRREIETLALSEGVVPGRTVPVEVQVGEESHPAD